MNRSRVVAIVRGVGILASLIAVSILWRSWGAADWLETRVIEPTRALGPRGWLVTVFVYAIATVCLVPGSALSLAIGDLYGVPLGATLVLLGANLGASGSFWISRTFARRAVLARFGKDRRYQAIDRAIAQRGAWVVLLLRLSPVIPFNMLNYALGATSIGYLQYVLASFVGMIPGTILYVSIGRAVLARTSPIASAWWIFGLVATAAATFFLARIARQAIRTEGIVDQESETST